MTRSASSAPSGSTGVPWSATQPRYLPFLPFLPAPNRRLNLLKRIASFLACLRTRLTGGLIGTPLEAAKTRAEDATEQAQRMDAAMPRLRLSVPPLYRNGQQLRFARRVLQIDAWALSAPRPVAGRITRCGRISSSWYASRRPAGTP